MEDNLLEEIAELLYKTCLSDLHSVSKQSLVAAASRIPKNKYSLEDWSYALTYICMCKVSLNNFEEIDPILKKLCQ